MPLAAALDRVDVVEMSESKGSPMHPLMLYLAVAQEHERRQRQVRQERALRAAPRDGADERRSAGTVVRRASAAFRGAVDRLAGGVARRRTRAA
jgi:hypothetical protein